MPLVVPPPIPPMNQRKHNILLLFDVDGTLTPARKDASPEMLALLQSVREVASIGYVGGSDLVKQQEQLGSVGVNGVLELFDYVFPENGLAAYKGGSPIASQSFIGWLGEDKYKSLVNFCLHYIADLDIPIKRGTFVEFRKGMINVSPIGRNASNDERNAFEAYDKQAKIRETFIGKIKEKFDHLGLTYSIGGQISFDIFPAGWDKTYALQHVENEGFDEIHFFGDKTYKGGNDYEIYTDKRVIGHSVTKPEDTAQILREMFSL